MRQKKSTFLVKISKKAKNAFFDLFFNFLRAAQKLWPNRVFIVLWESSEN